MQKIFELCPSLEAAQYRDQIDAIVRMCIAHVLNGGEYVGIYLTAENYLKELK